MLKLEIIGQVHGGKNHIGITKTGRRYPASKAFILWAKSAINQLRVKKWKNKIKTFKKDMNIVIDYIPGDLRTRDTPAILDAVYHVLEKAKIVENDKQFCNVIFTKLPLNRRHPKVNIELLERE